jgi:hypothetical protein
MSYYDYIENNGDNCIYIVTYYGCDSTPISLVTPESKLFKIFRDAHEYFLQISPDVNDGDNYAGKYISKFDSSKINEKYSIIEVRVQTDCYHIDYDNDYDILYSKRPSGAVFARCIL